jgi:hypothetical protein
MPLLNLNLVDRILLNLVLEYSCIHTKFTNLVEVTDNTAVTNTFSFTKHSSRVISRVIDASKSSHTMQQRRQSEGMHVACSHACTRSHTHDDESCLLWIWQKTGKLYTFFGVVHACSHACTGSMMHAALCAAPWCSRACSRGVRGRRRILLLRGDQTIKVGLQAVPGYRYLGTTLLTISSVRARKLIYDFNNY